MWLFTNVRLFIGCYCAKINAIELACLFIKKGEIFIKLHLPDSAIEYFPNFFSTEESKIILVELYQELCWRQDQISMFGKNIDIPRLQAWYGEDNLLYTYSKLTLTAKPWTENLLALKGRIEEFCGHSFNAVLANCYRDQNDSVGWHSDDEKELGEKPVIASLSFGSTRTFHLKHKVSGKKFKLPLHSGDLLIMAGATQNHWQHAILKSRVQSPMRINLTYRKIITK